jgi:glycosyltransferase involved in cell wall biosynthesis
MVKHILVIAPQPFYEDRGTPIAIRHVLESLSEGGYTVDLVTYPIGEDVRLPGLRILRGPNPFGFNRVAIGLSFRKIVLDLVLLPKILRLIRTGNYAYVHAIEELAFLATIPAKKQGLPLVYDMQSSLPEQLAYMAIFSPRWIQNLLRRVERWLLRRVTTTVCSAGLAKYVRKQVPDADVREWLFPSAASTPMSFSRTSALREIRIDPDKKVVVYTGNFQRYQGLSRVLDCVSLVTARRPNVVFLLVGAEGSDKDDLQAEYGDHIRSGKIVLLERQPYNQIRNFMVLADILVSPRDSVGNIPLKVFEYMEMEKPIVASDCHAHRSVLNQDRAVLVGSSPEDWANAIIHLLENSEHAAVLARNSVLYARELLTKETFRKMVHGLYESQPVVSFTNTAEEQLAARNNN